MNDSDSKLQVVSRKELSRQIRREAYQKAKAYRAADPRFIAMKEAVKERRRMAYQRVKAQRKVVAADKKTQEQEKRAQERAAADTELMGMVRPFTNGK